MVVVVGDGGDSGRGRRRTRSKDEGGSGRGPRVLMCESIIRLKHKRVVMKKGENVEIFWFFN